MRIVVTPDLISKVLHVSRVAHPDYHSCDRLRTMSKDELMSLFCETPSSWGDHQNTPCSTFAKGLRFLNMVMTFVLHPLFHYNSIIEPCARFLLSLLEDISIWWCFTYQWAELSLMLSIKGSLVNPERWTVKSEETGGGRPRILRWQS